MKLLNILGLTVFSIGGATLIGFGLYNFLNIFLKDSSVPFVVKLGITGLILGTIIILTSLIIERIKDKKYDSN